MTNPIYPDKTKTGLAALKPLTDVFFAEPERWEWESLEREEWRKQEPDVVVNVVKDCPQLAQFQRLTPKPRRVWIGDQSYEAHEFNELDSFAGCWLVDITRDVVTNDLHRYFDHELKKAANNYLLFWNTDAAKKCLDAHRRARRVE